LITCGCLGVPEQAKVGSGAAIVGPQEFPTKPATSGEDAMPIYKAPVEDVSFLFNDVFQIDRYNNLPGFADASADVREAILDEAANLFGSFETIETKLADLRSTLASSYAASYQDQVDPHYIGDTTIVPGVSVVFSYENYGTWPYLNFPYGKLRSACRAAFGIGEDGQAQFTIALPFP
jgi:hypothetical protein